MAFTADDFMENMGSRLGYSGKHVWLYYALGYGTPWCAGEISYTFAKIGGKSKWYGGRPVFYVPDAQEWMEKHWECVYSGPKRKGSLKNVKKSDIVIFSWKGWSRDHIGAARGPGYKATDRKWYLPSREGNTSGGIVADKVREKKYIHSVYRPPWKKVTKPTVKKKGQKYPGKYPKLPSRGYFDYGDKSDEVKKVQSFLGWALTMILDADGIYGPKTRDAVSAFEKLVKIDVDGQFGKVCLKAAKKFRR